MEIKRYKVLSELKLELKFCNILVKWSEINLSDLPSQHYDCLCNNCSLIPFFLLDSLSVYNQFLGGFYTNLTLQKV